jgi:hypothetical protein
MSLPREVFLSHSAKDRKYAAALADVLRVHGLKVWYSDTNIRNADEWHNEIGRALRRCDWFLLILTKNSCASSWVSKELMYALRKKQYENHILPILFRKCDYESLSWTLDGFQMVNCIGKHKIDYEAVLSTWGIAFDKGRLNV